MRLGNHFLDQMERSDLEALIPALRRVDLQLGEVLVEAGSEVSRVHFPIDAQLANINVFRDGSGGETSVVGSEGLSGLAAFLAETPCHWRVAVRRSGTAFVAPAPKLRTLRSASPALDVSLLRLSYFYQLQSAQSAACNAAHAMRPRVARWVLTAHDFTPDRRTLFTHEEIANLLGAQRTTIQDAMAHLRAVGAIDYQRGVIKILSRAVLEAEACECYELLRDVAADLDIVPAAREHGAGAV